RVDVRHRVDRGDGAPGPWVVDDRWEEVDGLDDRQIGRETIDRRVVSRAEPDEQIRGWRHAAGPEYRQHLLEISRSHFGRSAGAGRVGGEADPRGRVLGPRPSDTPAGAP